jgi:hypothetical protein
MGKKLSVVNFYLLDPAIRQESVYRSVASSSAIEGIRAPFAKNSGAPAKSASNARLKSNRKSRLNRV